MNPDTVRVLRETYDENVRNNEDISGIEDRLHESFNKQDYVTREQLQDVVRWKLNGQPGRRDGNIDVIDDVPEPYIQKVTAAALEVDDPELQLKTLRSIPRIGAATATVVLAFYDPEQYAVGDRYILDALFDEDRQMRITDYPKILEELRDRNPGGFDLRTVEKAYYQQYRDEHDVGRF